MLSGHVVGEDSSLVVMKRRDCSLTAQMESGRGRCGGRHVEFLAWAKRVGNENQKFEGVGQIRNA